MRLAPVRGASRRGLLTPLAAAAALALLATGAAPATADPTAPPPRLPSPAAAGRPAQNRDVTLVTGDTVHVQVGADGTYRTRTDLAPRPGGRTVAVQTLVDTDHVYVLPSDAAALVAAGRLDRRLFDVRELLRDGYTDSDTATLPVIVRYGGGAGLAPQAALPATTRVRALDSIHGAALAVDKKQAAAFWSSVGATPQGVRPDALGGRVASVWLDAKVHASLDQSVPMIGAPQAWAAGLDGKGVSVAILDTGIDDTHPDLAGKVAGSRSFVPGVATVRDGNGHGTHVASTVVGSGAASGGKYRGVAPGADLMIGKVLDDTGNGDESWIIAGMQWAATSGARVVSMSLGSAEPSDGTDPMSQAVDDLTAATGTLFVIAAGNSGPTARTVASPGAADAALTVAAVDKSDHLASFSSRGPRITDYALKPDIAAPGVNITAARAAGTALGPVVDTYYTTISGTSMATPHVAGAAAILAEEHPDWRADQLRAALAGTAKDDGYTAYQQGAGRVDVAAAYRAGVLPTTGKIDFGRLRYPQQGPPLTRTLSYRNSGDQPVTLALSATLRTESGAAAPAGMLAVEPDSVTVPAGGTADVTVTLDPTAGTAGLYSGAVVATAAGGIALRTPVGADKEPPGYELSIKIPPRAGAVATATGGLILRRTDKPGTDWIILPAAEATSVHLDEGTYQVSTTMVWADDTGDLDNEALLIDPQVEVHHDASVTLDAGRAQPITVATDHPTERYGATINAWTVPAGGTGLFGVVSGQLPYGVQPWVSPTGTVTVGQFYLDHQDLLGTPLVTAEVTGPGGFTLHPRYQHWSAKIPKLDGRSDLRVVDAGDGSAAAFAGIDVRGKVALIDLGDKVLDDTVGRGFAAQELQNAAKAGAAAVLAYPKSGRPVMGSQLVGFRSQFPLPVLGIPAGEGQALHARVARRPATVRIDSQPTIPQLYSLAWLERGGIPASLARRVADRDLATLHQSFHGDRPVTVTQSWGVRYPGVLDLDGLSAMYSSLTLIDVPGPLTRTEHLGPVSAGRLWGRELDTDDLQQFLDLDLGHDIEQFLGHTETADVVDRAFTRTETWGATPTVPGMAIPPPAVAAKLGGNGPECAVCRFGGVLPGGDILPIFTTSVDQDGRAGEATGYSNYSLDPERTGVDEWHLYSGGAELPQQSLVGKPGLFPYFVLPAGRATYRMTEHFQDWATRGGYGTRADTTWTFTSQAASGKDIPAGYDALGVCAQSCRVEPLIFLRYDAGLGLDNRSVVPGLQVLTVTAYRQPSATALPPLAGLRVSVSFDGGQHWTGLPAVPLGGGRYQVFVFGPVLPGSTGTVSLRTEAWDTAGDRVEQTVPDAYGLAAGRR
ncbi:MAG: S8 family serine peptidase [Mycobacteriales bacterium]